MERAVFLDRDGVLTRPLVRNGRPYAPRTLGEFELLPGVREALIALAVAGFRRVVVTNQPDVAAGTLKPAVLAEMHRRLREWLPLDAIMVCCHRDEDHCACRKPKPGMLLEAARELSLNLPGSFMVGDRWRDVSAGKAAGCQTVFIDWGYQEELREPSDRTVKTLAQACEIIVSQRTGVDSVGGNVTLCNSSRT